MVMKPRPFKLSCPQCSWSGTFAPSSDALKPHERPLNCPKCGAGDLQERVAINPVAIAMAQLRGRLGL